MYLLPAVLLALLPLVSAKSTTSTSSDVEVLTSKTFDEFIASEPLSLVEFYAPWCGHCQALEPKYEIAATQLLETCKLAKIDCTVETELCAKYEVKGYPTLKVFEGGIATPYQGARETDGIVTYMKKMKEPKTLELTDAAQVEDAASAVKLLVVAYLKDKESPEYKSYEEFANKNFLTYKFSFTLNEEAAKKASVSVPSLVLYKSFDEKKAVYSGKWEDAPISKFLLSESMPLAGEISPDNYAHYVNLELPIAYFFYSSDDDKEVAKKEVEPWLQKYKGKFVFAYISSAFEKHGLSMGCSGPYPWFVVQNPHANLKYPFSGPFNSDSMREHVDNVLSGTVEPFVKSEPAPETNDGPVKIVVGSTYQEIVMDKGKDVFLKVMATWCGHCKKLAPIWEDLGEKLKDSPNVVIAKLDGTANDLPSDAGFEVPGFPTLVLVKALDNSILTYEGDRTFDDLVKFLKKNAVNADSITIESAQETTIETPEDAVERDEL